VIFEIDILQAPREKQSEKTKITPELFNRYMDEGLKLKELKNRCLDNQGKWVGFGKK